MKQASPSRLACILVLSLLIILPLTLVAGLAASWTSMMGRLSTEIADREDQLARFRRMVRTLPELRAELDRVRADESFKSFYFDAPTAALAGAELQRLTQEIVTAANGRLLSTQILPEVPDERPPRVRVRTQIQGTTDTLLEILYAIEQARPFLFVEQISVRSSARPAQPERDPRGRMFRRATVDPASELTLRLDIFGFTLGGGA
jgi:general secretion pathway protein M